MRYFLRLSFNGKNYHGWQVQENAHSVQAEINKALSTYLETEIETTGCGRTDTGVHAKKFFLHFDVEHAIKNEKDFIYHVNCLLPFEISIHRIYSVADDAHARYDATSRTYRYFLHQFKNPFLNDTSYFFPYSVDIELMNKAANILLDYHDFGCFSKTRTSAKGRIQQGEHAKTNICDVKFAMWVKTEERLIFEITANRFLRNMVRAIVGTLLDVGENHLSIDDFKKIIEQGNRSDAGVSVPAHALFLTDVVYPFIKD